MKNKLRKSTKITIGIVAVVFFIVFDSMNTTHQHKVELKRRYDELIGPATEYVESKYDEKIIFEDGLVLIDGAGAFNAYPENNKEIRFRIIEWSNEKGFRDDYLERCAGWEASTIIDSIVKKYAADYSCYAGLDTSEETTDALLDFYTTNKRHLSWSDQEHFKELGVVDIRLYGYDESTLEKTMFEPILSDILSLDFTTETVIFKLYKNEGDKKAAEKYFYEYQEGEYHLSDY